MTIGDIAPDPLHHADSGVNQIEANPWIASLSLYAGMSVIELAELDLSYAPPYAPVWANRAFKLV